MLSPPNPPTNDLGIWQTIKVIWSSLKSIGTVWKMMSTWRVGNEALVLWSSQFNLVNLVSSKMNLAKWYCWCRRNLYQQNRKHEKIAKLKKSTWRYSRSIGTPYMPVWRGTVIKCPLDWRINWYNQILHYCPSGWKNNSCLLWTH
jgi:hypothetical protein